MAIVAQFRATLQLHGKTATGIEVPPQVVEELGAGKRPPVRVTIITINGSYTYRNTIAPMGGKFLLGVSAEHRQGAGITAGDDLEIQLELDNAVREVVVPVDLAAEFEKHPQSKEYFTGLSYSHQRQYVEWIEQAKKAETRQQRIDKAIAMLEEKRTLS